MFEVDTVKCVSKISTDDNILAVLKWNTLLEAVVFDNDILAAVVFVRNVCDSAFSHSKNKIDFSLNSLMFVLRGRHHFYRFEACIHREESREGTDEELKGGRR